MKTCESFSNNLETKYKMEYVDIQEYIKVVLFNHLNWMVKTPPI